jgi:hypothetical protein
MNHVATAKLTLTVIWLLGCSGCAAPLGNQSDTVGETSQELVCVGDGTGPSNDPDGPSPFSLSGGSDCHFENSPAGGGPGCLSASERSDCIRHCPQSPDVKKNPDTIDDCIEGCTDCSH